MGNLRERLLDLNVFVDNLYFDKYVELIESNLNNVKIKYYTHAHHIIPKYYYKYVNVKVDNSASNIVHLNLNDHVLAHYYLMKCLNVDILMRSNVTGLSKLLYSSNIVVDKKIENEINSNFSKYLTAKYNPSYGLIGRRNKHSKVVYKYSLDGKYICKYESASLAAKNNNIKSLDSVSACCKGKIKSCGGYIFSYLKDDSIKYHTDFIRSPVYQFDLNGNFLKEYESVREAAKENNLNEAAIIQSFKRTHRSGNYLWYYKNDNDSIKKYKRGISSKKKIYQFDLNGNLLHVYNSLKEASDSANVSKTYMVNFCLKGKGKKGKDYIWKSEE